jgi:tRNA (guanine37-N1)-methyltransferase
MNQMKLKDTLRTVLSRDEMCFLVGSFDVIGDTAIIIIPDELAAKERLIAEALLQTHKNIRTVAKRVGTYDGEFRTIALAVIGGEVMHETEHRENGVRFFLHPEKVYFSVRSSNERKRVSLLVRPGEDVLVLFSGIGAFPLVIAANSQAGDIVGIEKNPDAHRYALKSLAGNKRIRNVVFYEGDVVDIIPRLSRRFDRVLMPLPRTSQAYLAIALTAVRTGGQLHFYDFQSADTSRQSIEKIDQACRDNDRKLITAAVTVCGHCSPRTYRICVDALIE